ncbi:MAG: rhodanese-like domain-containing protein [Pseudohongiellaceae bacterium]
MMFHLILHASLSSLFFGLFGVSWDAVDRKIENEFPKVQFISTERLHGLRTEGRAAVRLFDVREAEEFSVSHLEGALNYSQSADIAAAVPNKHQEIVVYCSVGYRSAAVAAELVDLGYSNVKNLRHSIFEWAEKGLPLEGQAGEEGKVHPYNRAWGVLIDSSMHQYPQ